MTEEPKSTLILTNVKYFPAYLLPLISRKLESIPEDKAPLLQTIEYKNPTTALLLSLFLGQFGADRFYLKDTARAVIKLVTHVIASILAITIAIINLVVGYEPTYLLLPKILMWIIDIANFLLVVIDWFEIQHETRVENYRKLMNFKIK